MANKMEEIALQQEIITVDGQEYMLEAWPATYSLDFMEKHSDALESGKADLSIMKKVICASVYRDGKLIGEKSFDIIFSRKISHLISVYQEVLQYNLGDLFTQPDSEDK